MPRNIVYVPGSSRKVSQLTGEFDRALGPGRLAPNQTETRWGLRGTDLGASFEHKGRCYFLFGDTHPFGPNNDFRPLDGDAIAYATDTQPDAASGGVRLHFVTAPDGAYLSPRAPDLSTGGFEVPTGGFSDRGRMYVFYTTDARIVPGKGAVMNCSVLLRSDDDGRTFQNLYTVSQSKIIYVAPGIVDNSAWPGLPEKTGRGLLLWSAGTEYRRGDPYLAHLPLARVEDRSALRYFAGTSAKTKRPHWSDREADAAPLFAHPCVGELCVTWNPFLRQWLMLYNCDERPGPRGINFRVSDTPWGPWSPTAVLFHPRTDNGYGRFIHAPGPTRDALHDPGRENDWGGEYGPYVIERFTKGDAARGRTTIFYTLSTWNPYNVVLMTATLEARPGKPPSAIIFPK